MPLNLRILGKIVIVQKKDQVETLSVPHGWMLLWLNLHCSFAMYQVNCLDLEQIKKLHFNARFICLF